MTRQERNKLIYARHEEGYTQDEIGRFYNLSQSRVSAIILKIKRGECEPSKETRGAKSRLSDQDLSRLQELLSRSGDGTDFIHWNKWSVKRLIKEEFGIDYHQNYVWALMKKIGYTSQRPQKKDYRQDAEEVQKFKDEKAVDIKKRQSKNAG